MIFTFFNIDIKGANNFHYDYMDLKYTSSIRGIFVWLIIFRHYYSFYRNKKYLYIKILNFLGQQIVSLFLFYSGYGIFESIKAKGANYLKTLPKKIIIFFIKFQIILFFYLLINIILGIKISLRRYLLSMVFKTTIGNSNWFTFTIIAFYFYSYISFISVKKERFYLAIIYLNIIIIIHIYLVYNYFFPKISFPIDNSFCFIFGFYYSLIRKFADRLLMKDDSYYFLIVLIIKIIYYFFYINLFRSLLNRLMRNCFFCIIVVFISLKIRFYNSFLIFLNSHSFSIYLLQRIIMIIVSHKQYFENNEFIRLSFEFTAIISLSCIFDKYFKTEKLFFRENKLKKNKLFLSNNEELIKIMKN